jgi:hypothetical protein
MSCLRRLWPAVVLASLATLLAIGVPRAEATDPFPSQGIATLSSAHFTVFYNRDNLSQLCPKGYITQETAGDVLGMAERAYSLYTSWGYTPPAAPMNDISVDDFQETVPCISNGSIDASVPRNDDGSLVRWNALLNPSDDQIHLDATTGLAYHTIAHEVFHLFAVTLNSGLDQWLQEGTSEWAAFRAESFLTPTETSLGRDPDRTADCVGSECGDTELDRNGYPGWLLFEYLSERFGTDAVRAVLADPGTPGTTALSDVLVAHGTTLAAFFNDYTTARLTGNFSLAAIKGILPATQGAIPTGVVTGSLPTTNVAVNHLAVKFVTLHHGNLNDTGRGPCYAATLALNVAIPAGVTSTPYYYANTIGSTAQALTVSGSNATISIPWNTCSGSPDAYLSLPNDSLGLDGREFVITGTVSVDLNSPAAPSDPQPGTVIVGPVVIAPTSDPAPTLIVHAPELIRVSARDRLLRFIVFSSGSGNLRAALGSVFLGTASLRAGNNDVRWRLPASLVSGLRRTASTNVLSLTSFSPSGTAGATLTRHVVIVPAKKKKHR